MKIRAAYLKFTVTPLLVVLSSCSVILPNKNGQDWLKEQQAEQKAGMNAYEKAGGRLMRDQNSGIVVNAGVASARRANSAGITPASDLVWAPENPNEAMSTELTSAWKDPASKSWQTSLSEASQLARSSEKPMLVWFTDSSKSPLCNALNSELFSTNDFEKWAKENVIRLSVDQFVSNSNTLMAEESEKKLEADRVSKLFGVNGHPTIVVLTPNGKVIDKHKGFKKGDSAYFWGRIKHSTNVALKQHGAWREQMEKRGYRMWQNRSGKQIFAKLAHYTPQKTSFIEPNGKRSTTYTKQLSDADQSWLTSQKKKHDQAKRN